MKECPHCAVFLFDDQHYCFECMSSLHDPGSDAYANEAAQAQMICIGVAFGDSFSYETHMRRTEGAILSVGSASENAIVIPQPEILEHQFDIFFSQGHLWIEDKSTATDKASASHPQLNGVPLNGTRSVQPGTCITVGNARLSLA